MACDVAIAGFCGGLLKCGPEAECKAAGCELTLGVGALEGLFGIWHVATEMFPAPLPPLLFPCCCGPCIPCPGGVHEEFNGGNFKKSDAAVITKKIHCLEYICGSCAASLTCQPYKCIMNPYCGLSPIGLCSDPAFGGGPGPFWYTFCNKCVWPSLAITVPTFGFTPPSIAFVPFKCITYFDMAVKMLGTAKAASKA